MKVILTGALFDEYSLISVLDLRVTYLSSDVANSCVSAQRIYRNSNIVEVDLIKTHFHLSKICSSICKSNIMVTAPSYCLEAEQGTHILTGSEPGVLLLRKLPQGR